MSGPMPRAPPPPIGRPSPPPAGVRATGLRRTSVWATLGEQVFAVKSSSNKSLRDHLFAATMAEPPKVSTLFRGNDLNEELSDRQSRILEYIQHVSRTRNYPPSVREIGEPV